ncbi:hypothetical protein [Nocardia sp. CA-290969]|uniref:hypothetical protein n=1 Tax=Nocardia sp. CA-290969 TaxID=3239986 RepID=UPI003D94E8EA
MSWLLGLWLTLGLVLSLTLGAGIIGIAAVAVVTRWIVTVGGLVRGLVAPAVGVLAAIAGVVLPQRFRAPLHTRRGRGGQILRRQGLFQTELTVVEGSVGRFTSDLTRHPGHGFLRRVLRSIRQRIPAFGTARNIARGQPIRAHRPGHRAGRRGGQRGLTRLFQIIHRDVVTTPGRDLHRLDPDIQGGFLQRRRPRPTHRRTRSGFHRGLRNQPLQQLFDRGADRDPGDGLRDRGPRPRRGSADTGGRGSQQDRHLHSEDREAGQDHQFGVFDIGGAVADLIGQGFDMFDQPVERALPVAEFGPAVADGLGGVAFDRGQHLVDGVVGVGADLGQIGRQLGPGRFHPAHRGFIALGPITGTGNVFTDPLQGFGDLDTHSAHHHNHRTTSDPAPATASETRKRAAHGKPPPLRQQNHHPYRRR